MNLNLLWQVPLGVFCYAGYIGSVGCFLFIIWLGVRYLFTPEELSGPEE